MSGEMKPTRSFETIKGGCHEITQEEYFFCEWLIIEKGITEEKFKQLTPSEFAILEAEYNKFKNALSDYRTKLKETVKCEKVSYCNRKEKLIREYAPGNCVSCGECAGFDICPGREMHGVTEDSWQCFCCGYREKD